MSCTLTDYSHNYLACIFISFLQLNNWRCLKNLFGYDLQAAHTGVIELDYIFSY